MDISQRLYVNISWLNVSNKSQQLYKLTLSEIFLIKKNKIWQSLGIKLTSFVVFTFRCGEILVQSIMIQVYLNFLNHRESLFFICTPDGSMM